MIHVKDDNSGRELLPEKDREALSLFYSYDGRECMEEITRELRRRRVRMVRRSLGYAASLFLGIALAGIGVALTLNDKKGATVDGSSGKAYLELTSGDFFMLSDELTLVDDEEGKNQVRGIHEFGIVELNGEKVPGASDNQVVAHRMFTPEDSKYKLMLSDGTRVHMNKSSALIFPGKFNEFTREVYLSGEAHFAVVKDEVPFIVRTDNAVVRVLGTQFNVNSYPNQGMTAVTLEEGHVIVEVNETSYEMRPGMQLRIDNNGAVTVELVDTAYYTQWRDSEIIEGSIGDNISKYNASFIQTPGEGYFCKAATPGLCKKNEGLCCQEASDYILFNP